MTLHISRRRRHRRVADQLTPDTTNLIAGKLNQQSMSAIARELNLPVHAIKHVRDNMKQTQVKPRKRDARREAELYVLSRVGKCTDDFAEYEAYVHRTLTPVKYERDMSRSLAKIRVIISPSESN